MSLSLSAPEMIARARADLRIGAPVCVDAGGAAAVVMAAELVTPERLEAMRALGDVDLAISDRRAGTLKARAYDGDLARIVVDAATTPARIRAAVDPSRALTDPMAGPFATRRGGDAAAHRLALRLVKQARLLPAALVAPVPDAAAAASAMGLTLARLQDMALSDDAAARLSAVSVARVPLEVSEDARVHVFRPADGAEEHYAIEIGQPPRGEPALCRLHSACFTGDLIGSLKCDCGPQLRAALAQIGAEGAGVLLYLNQEGRGIGLANKMRAYALQDAGFDTVEANHRLGFEDDERDFRIGAEILKSLGFSSVRLMTNNPGKVVAMAAAGVSVAERVPLRVGVNPHNTRYLAVKAAKSGHLL
ncbi:GTP cyclohydrolase II [Rubrimonas cliftonensis]|uniref:GTP cyclohydrolase-2 n=1 Tax=Rubrimonas cliftonensis TaxID=89524 RepID=A0A1H3Z242_9RHOB|nr:GTP cyclohydrolase II [Rubrimonas cliftonensis]SEA17829.1 GTP cyclohydrolase II [Rubrimonas cliftonensis]